MVVQIRKKSSNGSSSMAALTFCYFQHHCILSELLNYISTDIVLIIGLFRKSSSQIIDFFFKNYISIAIRGSYADMLIKGY